MEKNCERASLEQRKKKQTYKEQNTIRIANKIVERKKNH